MTIKTVLALLLMSAALRAPAELPASASGERELKKAERKAFEAVDERKAARLKAYQDLQQLRRDLDYVAAELDRERVGPRQDLKTYSEGCLARLEYVKKNGRLDSRLYDPNERPQDPDKVLSRLEKICRELPGKTYAADYPRSLVRALATELREAAENGRGEADILATLRKHLVLPEQLPGKEDAFGDLSWFPTDVPLDRFLKLGALRHFLVKHRLGRPSSHARTDAESLVAGKHNVQIGVEIEGEVLSDSGCNDGDHTFNIGDAHLEITPEWRALHPGMHLPVKGDRVRVRGWTYYDYSHASETEYDPEDPVIGVNRATLWEIHPVQSVELLSKKSR